MSARSFVALLIVSTLVPLAMADHPQAGSGKTVAFDHKTGNEWWVEAILSGPDAASVAKVEARDDGGPWVTMEKKSWGSWAASFLVEAGHRVQFRASWSGAQLESCWFTHPGGVEQCASAAPFDATFSGVRGNEWWAEAVVKANVPVDTVRLAINCDIRSATPMTYRADWGKWVLSMRIPPGAKVVLAAYGAGGNELSGGYLWPQATPTSGCASFDATFSGVKGNEWWVETKAVANEAIAGVDARIGCGADWRPLTLRSWGNWAASFHVPAGSTVDFRARSAHGGIDLSDSAYVWPAATPTEGCGDEWPHAGSAVQVRFRTDDRWSDVDGAHRRIGDGLIEVTYTGVAWDGVCTQAVSYQRPDGTWDNRTESSEWDQAPPMGTVPATVGGTATVQVVGNCALTTVPDQPVVGRETRPFSIRTSSGDPVPIDAYHAETTGTGHDEDYWWDARHGLMLSWDQDVFGSHNSSHADGWLLSAEGAFP